MGSFDASCGISNLYIRSHEPIRMILLAKNTGYHSSIGIYPTDEWIIVGVPIPGTYDDYGRMRVTGGDQYEFTFDLAQTHSELELVPTSIDEFFTELRTQSNGTKIANREVQYTYVREDVYQYLTKGWEKLAAKVIILLNKHKATTPGIDAQSFSFQEAYALKDVLPFLFDWQNTLLPHAGEVLHRPESFPVEDAAQLAVFLENLMWLYKLLAPFMSAGQEPHYTEHAKFYSFLADRAQTLQVEYNREYEEDDGDED